MDHPNLAGKAVIVTEPSSGIGAVILRALRAGEERIDIPHGPEQPDFPASVPG